MKLILALACACTAQAQVYDEALRPQVHFTASEGWINDPNGLIYLDGTYHLFFQHQTSKVWGHATSQDLLYWAEQPIALPQHRGNQVYSGCVVLDSNNTSNLKKGLHPPLVAVYTSWGEGQCLALSHDKGNTWERYAGNPVLRLPSDEKRSYPLSARDPNVFWHAQSARWVMLLYQNIKQQNLPNQPKDMQGGLGVFTSKNLREWTFESHLEGFYVCPDLLELPIDNEPGHKKWVVMDWERYGLVSFDGRKMNLESPIRRLDYGANLSANQTWKNMPQDDHRLVQISWLRGGKYPGMPFDQQLSIPVELGLRRMGSDLMLTKRPITELARLHGKTATWTTIPRDSRELAPADQAVDVVLSSPQSTNPFRVELSFGGTLVTISQSQIECLGKTMPLRSGGQEIRFIYDRTSIEIFANQNTTTMSFCCIPEAKYSLASAPTSVAGLSLMVTPLKSIWAAQ
jgi:fructan beta-fructosidase